MRFLSPARLPIPPHSQMDLAELIITDAPNNLIKILVNGYITAVTDSLELSILIYLELLVDLRKLHEHIPEL